MKLLPHLHWPMMTMSPSETRKHGETWAGTLLCRFSYLHVQRVFRIAHAEHRFLVGPA